RETVWGKVYRLCRNTKARPPSTVKRVDGTFTSDAAETSEYLLNRFLPDDNAEQDDEMHRCMRAAADCWCTGVLPEDDCRFSSEEISDIIARQNDRKAPG